MKKSQLAINSISTRHADLEEALAAYSAAGFTHVEFALPQVRKYLSGGKTEADARRLLDRHHLRCIGGFHTHLEVFSPAESRAKNHATILANARLLRELGGNNLVLGTDGPSQPVADPVGDIAAALGEVAAQVAETGVNLLVEFNWSPVVKSLRTAVDAARRSGAKNVGVLFDPAHYHCTPTKFEMIHAESVRWIRHVHLNDMRDKPGELSNCNSDRVLPGQGCLDLRALLGALEKHGYRGGYSIEMFNEELWAMPAARAARLMYESLLPYCD